MALLETLEKVIIVCIVFVAGMFASALYNGAAANEEIPSITTAFSNNGPLARENPSDWVAEKQITVYRNQVILDIDEVEWARFTDTHSMEPVLSSTSNAIEIVPESEDDIKVGDIVSYRSEYADGTIIHRVVYKGEDEKGTYFIMKGDNNPTSDPGRIRFSQVQRVVVGIIY